MRPWLRKDEAAKVAAAEREKKKTHDPEEALGNNGEGETDYAQGERAR
jgi:hypothetical protein